MICINFKIYKKSDWVSDCFLITAPFWQSHTQTPTQTHTHTHTHAHTYTHTHTQNLKVLMDIIR